MQNKKTGGSNFKKLWLPLFLFAVAVIVFYKVVDRLPQVFATFFEAISVIGPFIGGIIIAFLLYKPAFALESLCLKSKKSFFKKHARGISVLCCYLALTAILAVILYLLLPRIFSSAMSLVQNLPDYYNSAMEYVKALAGEDGRILGFDINGFLNNLSVTAILKYFDISSVGKYAGEILGATGRVVDVLMAFVVSVYVLLGRNHLLGVFKKLLCMLIPRERVSKLGNISVRSAHIFYNYIYSQLVDSVIVSVIMAVIFVCAPAIEDTFLMEQLNSSWIASYMCENNILIHLIG